MPLISKVDTYCSSIISQLLVVDYQFREIRVSLAGVLGPSAELSRPPAGSVNVKVGDLIIGPGGSWVPCATRAGKHYLAGLFQIGPGQRQVCEVRQTFANERDAYFQAVKMATSAAS